MTKSEREKLLEEILEAVSATAAIYNGTTTTMERRIKQAIAALPFFAAPPGEREPDYKDWPDAAGFWYRMGQFYYARWYSRGHGLNGEYEIRDCRNGNQANWSLRDECDKHGHWLPCTVAPASPASKITDQQFEEQLREWYKEEAPRSGAEEGEGGREGMRLHERTMPVQKARVEFDAWVLDWANRHDLTYGEVFGILAERMGAFAKMMRREERHPDDPDKRADEA